MLPPRPPPKRSSFKYSQVYKGRRKHTGQTVALKFISKHGKSAKDIRNLRQEIAILRTLNHENIILMFDAFETDREFCVVTEYAQVIGFVCWVGGREGRTDVRKERGVGNGEAARYAVQQCPLVNMMILEVYDDTRPPDEKLASMGLRRAITERTTKSRPAIHGQGKLIVRRLCS